MVFYEGFLESIFIGMARLRQEYEAEGYYGIGVLHMQDEMNIGTLWRRAFILGASFIFTVDKKYKRQSSDVTRTWTKIPLYHYDSVDDLRQNLPLSTQLVGVELTEGAVELNDFKHPARAVYLLGSESVGLPPKVLDRCHSVISLPGAFSMNVSVTGSIVAHHRYSQIGGVLPRQG